MIRYAVTQCKKGQKTSQIAKEIRVSQRQVQRLYARFCKTGSQRSNPCWKKVHTCHRRRDAAGFGDVHTQEPVGVLRMVGSLKTDCGIIYRRAYGIMKEHGLVTPSATKSRKRKWVRFERRCPNAMWHVDWHVMKDPRFRGLNLVTYLDDASRCMVAAAAHLFPEATSENAVTVLRKAIETFGTPAIIPSDNGSCFVDAAGRHKKGRDGRRRKAPAGSWQPTVFEAEMLDRGIELINTRPYNPHQRQAGVVPPQHRGSDLPLRVAVRLFPIL